MRFLDTRKLSLKLEVLLKSRITKAKTKTCAELQNTYNYN